MRKGTFRHPASYVQVIMALLVTLAIGQPVLAQTPGLTDLTLTSSLGTNSVDDAIQCTYTLTGSATTAAVAWYRNSQPAMTLYLPFEGGATAALQDYSGRGMTPSSVGNQHLVGHCRTGGHWSIPVFRNELYQRRERLSDQLVILGRCLGLPDRPQHNSRADRQWCGRNSQPRAENCS